ncbi:MAG: lipid-A-disaccharide synthase [Desulfuromonadales bacterium]
MGNNVEPRTSNLELDQRRAMIVTGEASGDLHGAHLIRAAGDIDPGLSFFGVGGRLMEEAGCEILIPGEELAVMGLVEVLGHFPVIWRAFNRLKKVLHGPDKPDMLILIDFPDFNLRLARQAKAAGVPVLYYVSPQVWAWRRGRVKKIAAVVDRLAAILPFEPDFYRDEDIEVEYVGNPLTDEARTTRDRSSFLAEHGLEPDRPVVGLFPGSRRNELRYIFGTIVDTAQLLHRKNPELQFLLPVASSLRIEEIEEYLAGRDLPVTLVQDNVYDAIGACDAVVTVSGTATLQTALIGTPMAILYKMSPLTYAIGKRLIKVPHIGLANIVAGRRVVAEFIQDEANPQAVAAEILRLLEDEGYRRQVKEGLKLVRERIGDPGCSERVARMASEMSRGMVRSLSYGKSRGG